MAPVECSRWGSETAYRNIAAESGRVAESRTGVAEIKTGEAETRTGVAEIRTGMAEVAEVAENRRAPTPRIRSTAPHSTLGTFVKTQAFAYPPSLIGPVRPWALRGGEHGALHVGRPRGDRLCGGRGGRTGQRYEVRETDGHSNSWIAFYTYPFPRTYQGPETHLAACHSHAHIPPPPLQSDRQYRQDPSCVQSVTTRPCTYLCNF